MGALHLLIQPNGSKLWRLAYRFGGKQKTLAIGVYPTVTLKHAREKRDEAKRLLADNIDPATQRRLEKLTAASGNTFRAVAEEVLAKLEREGRAAVTLAKKRWLLDFAYPAIGERPIGEIRQKCLRFFAKLRRAGDTRPRGGYAAPAAWCFGMPSRPAGRSAIRQSTCEGL